MMVFIFILLVDEFMNLHIMYFSKYFYDYNIFLFVFCSNKFHFVVICIICKNIYVNKEYIKFELFC